MNNEFSLSNVKGKNSFDSTTSSFKSKKASFRNQPSIINQIKNKNKNINALLKNNLSRNVKNLPICISQVTNLKNFHQLSTKLSPKENRNNSLISHSKETLFAKEDSFKDNNKIYSFKNRKQSNNMSFNKYISRNKNCLVINDLLLNPSFDNLYKNITPKKNIIKSDKENSSLLLKLSPIKLSSIKMPSIIHSPSGNIKRKIKDLKKKYLLNNINNNSTTIDKNKSDINIMINKTKNLEELNALSSFDLFGNNIINITNNSNIELKINSTIKNYANLKRSFNKNKKLNKIMKNKYLLSKMNNSLLEDKNSEKKSFQNKLFSLVLNDTNFNQKDNKLRKLIFEQNTKNKSDEEKRIQIQSNIIGNESENKEEKDDSSFFLSKEKSSIFQTLKNNWERNNKKQKEKIQENTKKEENNNLDEANKNLIKTNLNETENNINKNSEILNKKIDNKESFIKNDNNNEKLNKADNNNENKENKENNKNDVNNAVKNTIINKSSFNKNKKGTKTIKLNFEEKNSSKSIFKEKNKSKISRKKTFAIKDYNDMKNKYTKITIDSNKSFLEKNEFLNDLYKNVDKNHNKINKKLLNMKVGFLNLNEAKIESSIIKEYNNYKHRNSIKINLNQKESEVLNIKVLDCYKKELKHKFQKYKEAIYEHKYKYNNISNSLNTTKYHFNHYINKKYNFDSFDSLKTKKDINVRRKSIEFSLEQIKKIQHFIKKSPENSVRDNNFAPLKTKALYFNNEINWKNQNTNFLWIHRFILKEHYSDLNEEKTCNYKLKENSEISDNTEKKKTLKNYVSDKNIIGFRTLFRQNSIIRFSPSVKLRSFSRSPSFIDLSSIRKNSMEIEKKKEKPKNINDFSLLSIKQFYNLKNYPKKKKYLEKDSLLNIEEMDDDNSNESEDNRKIPFILQLKESDYNIINKGEYLLENSRTIEDIYIGLCFLIVEGKEKLFINKIKELKNDIDINNQTLEGNTFLIISTREGNKNITKFLCEKGCELNIQNLKGNTALHYAIANLFFDIVDILISFGAREDIINKNGLRPWDCIDNNLD